jgi:uncharacterized protein YdeI (YjbR/CyaY-like superfamily)
VSSAPSLRSFRTPAAFRTWLARNHAKRRELLMRCFKVHASHRGVTYKQALEEALCWGWIDGVRRSVDAISFSTRFTPRQRRSVWSRINVALAHALIEAGRMAKPGRVAFEAREAQRIGIYSFERKRARLTGVYAKALRANGRAWSYFKGEAPWYQRTSGFWVMSAKREETRFKRLELLVIWSEKGQRIPPLQRP